MTTNTIIPTGRPPVMPLGNPLGKSPDSIYSLWVARKNKNAKVLSMGNTIRRIYNGDWETALPEMESRERTQVANLFTSGIDQHAQRIASVMPNHMFPPERNSRAARERAQDRRQVIQGWHEENRMPLKFRKRARHLIGYATSPVYLRPGENGIPIWTVCDPLTTFPSPMADDEMVPEDCIFSFRRSYAYLQATYDIRGKGLKVGKDITPDTMLDVLLYCGEEETVMCAVGVESDGGRQPTCMLQRVPNPTGRSLTVIPGRITLDRLQGQFDQMVGMYESSGLLWAMHLQALKRSIFPETWIEGRPNESINVISMADAISGDVGQVEGGQIKSFRADPSVQTGQSIDRLERTERIQGAVPAEMGGESGSNIRTARRGTQVLAGAIDYPIQEHQELLAYSLHDENLAAIAIAKAYWPNTERTLYVSFGDGQITYTPNTTFTIENHSVQYAYSGTDSDGLVIQGLQRVGAGTLSQQSFMEIDPIISDAAFEHDRIVAEGIEKALLSSIQQQAADPAGPYQPADLADLMKLLTDQKKTLAEAISIVQKRSQERQAQQAQGELAGPEAQPGLSMAGAPGTPQAGQPPVPSPDASPDQQGLAGLMSSLRSVNRGVGPVPAQG